MAAVVIGAALLAFPRRFRRRHGAALRQAAEDRLTKAPAGGRRTPLLRLLLNLLATGFSERVADARERWAWPERGEATGRARMGFPGAATMHLRQALRLFWRQPLFTATAVLTLALGIGASLAILTVANAVLLRPLSYADADRLVMIWSDNPHENRPRNPVSPADFLDYRSATASFSAMEAMYSFLTPVGLQTGAGPEMIQAFVVTPGTFRLLGREAEVGRTFRNGETGVAVLSHAFWQTRFGGDPGVVGRKITMDGQVGEVVGVMPPDFVFPYRTMLGPGGFTRAVTADVWLPLEFRGPRMIDARGAMMRNVHYLAAIGRLEPGRSIEQARADLATVARNLAQAYPDTNKGWGATVVPLYEQTVGDVRPALLLLLVGVGVLMLTSCVNVANLVLARSAARQRELALRSALGASRFRLVLQVLTETLVLSSAGALVALFVVGWGIRALVALAPPEIPRIESVRPDATVLVAALAAAVVAGLLAGLVPALATTRADIRGTLQEGSRGTIGGRHRRTRAILVVAEVSLAVVLSIGAVLLGRSFLRLLDVDPGFRPDHLLTMQMNVPPRFNTADLRRQFYDDFFQRLETLPGVSAVGGTTRLPLGSTNVSTQVIVEGRALDPARLPEVEFRRALRRYFRAMGIPVLQGRDFDERDTAAAPPVAVINQAAARRLFSGEDPVGKRVQLGSTPGPVWMTIVGVVGDVRHVSLDTEPAPELYVCAVQNPPVAPFIVLRAQGDPAALAAAVRARAREIDRDLPIFDVRTMEQLRSESMARRRFLALLALLFGATALALASAGVYGVMALSVAERTQEIGVRLALGARPAQMWALVVRQGLTLIAAGVCVGLVLARLTVPLMASQLFGIDAADPLTLVLVPIVLVGVALLACYVPARRAMRVDPLTALRCE
jgi:putative ABC transport system permease protein